MGTRFLEAIQLDRCELLDGYEMMELTFLISSSVDSSGLSPPCTQKNLPSTIAASGNAQNDLIHAENA
jgi:hypothetical protein